MKRMKKAIGILVLAAMAAFSFSGCQFEEGQEDEDLARYSEKNVIIGYQ